MNQQALSSFIWSVADLLRGDYKQSEYGKVILPFTVLRRLDCVLEPTKVAVLAEHDAKKKLKLNAVLGLTADAECRRRGLRCRRSRECNNPNCPKACCAGLQKRVRRAAYGHYLPSADL
jgi:hypothetical protein